MYDGRPQAACSLIARYFEKDPNNYLSIESKFGNCVGLFRILSKVSLAFHPRAVSLAHGLSARARVATARHRPQLWDGSSQV